MKKKVTRVTSRRRREPISLSLSLIVARKYSLNSRHTHTCTRVKRLSRNLIEREEKTRKSPPLLPLVLIKQSWIKRQVKTPGANYRPITRAIRGSRLASSETKTRGEAPLLERDRARASENERVSEREKERDRARASERERERGRCAIV